ncbi:MAG: thiol peroxidase [Bacteroidales bacterium]|nr:thiol peroxidase [Bacteroidales bacterium]
MEKHKGIVAFKGQPMTLVGSLTQVGKLSEDFTTFDTDLKPVTLSQFRGKTVVLSIMPSVDTPVCAQQTRKFNELATSLEDVVVITISMDLPFALKRFCASEGIRNVITSSDYKHREFGYKYGFYIEELGLLARGIVIIDKEGRITYVEYVPEISQEPDYEKALDHLRTQRK